MSKLPSEFLEEGWCQGRSVRFTEDGENRCMVGAISAWGSRWVMPHYEGIYVDYIESVHVLLGGGPKSGLISGWNDAPERTQAEVVALARMVEVKLGLRPMETEAEAEKEVMLVG